MSYLSKFLSALLYINLSSFYIVSDSIQSWLLVLCNTNNLDLVTAALRVVEFFLCSEGVPFARKRTSSLVEPGSTEFYLLIKLDENLLNLCDFLLICLSYEALCTMKKTSEVKWCSSYINLKTPKMASWHLLGVDTHIIFQDWF